MSQRPAYYPDALAAAEPSYHHADVVVYGGTSGGVVAAVAADRRKRSAILLVFNDRIGGMTVGGLGRTDVGNQAAFGGISREFFQRHGNHYGEEISWNFEPHIAEQTYHQLLKEAGVAVLNFQRLASVEVQDQQICSLTTEAGHFIDACFVLFDRAFNGGNVEIQVPKLFPVSYRSLVPRKAEVRNLLVPWALSASH